MIAVSSCLAGINCKYSGGNNLVEPIKKLVDEGKAICVCPEMLGGLPCPRLSCEIVDGKVINTNGEDKTKQYLEGSEKAINICKEHNVHKAILKAYSPSCGVNTIYDGSFTHTKINGDGIFAKRCKEEGIEVIDDIDYLEGENK